MDSVQDIAGALPELPFSYEALPDNHIRLLEVEHDGGDTIRCRLRSVDLASKPLYNALSYTWGDPRPEISQEPGFDDFGHEIILNGCRRAVQTNLYNLLLRLQPGSPATGIPIWIDALCINQTDTAEKSIQVEKMDQVYKCADAVFAWLGGEDDYTVPGFAAIRTLADLHHAAGSDYASYSPRDVSEYGLSEWDWTSLVAIFMRAWFTRIWVVQEVALARRVVVMCGNEMLPGELFANAVEFLVRTSIWERILPYRMTFTPHEHRHAGGQGLAALGPVAWALEHFSAPPEKRIVHPRAIQLMGRGGKASNPKDCIYALRGLIKDAIAQSGYTDTILPAISYEETVQVEDVFIEWAKSMFGDVENFYLFSMVEDPSHRVIKSLPSWVPDMSVSMMPLSFRHVRNSGSWKPFGSNDGGWVLYNDDPRTIEVPAAHFDTITAVAKDFYSFDGPQDQVSVLEFIEPLVNATSPYTDPLEALARVMAADPHTPREQSQSLGITVLCWMVARIIGDKPNMQALSALAPILRMASRNHAVRQAFARMSTELRGADADRLRQVQAFEARTKLLRSCRRLVRTRRNYLGIAGTSASVGDGIWILPAAIIPFVMRKREDGKHELIGEAYVQGIMNGEVAESLEWQEIQIS